MPTTTFNSTVLEGTIYVGFDSSPLGTFLGSDAPSLQNQGSSNDQLNSTFLDLTGAFNVTAAEAGPATFTLDSDDGSVLSVDGTVIVHDDSPASHAATEVSNATVSLSAGPHIIEIEYYNSNASSDTANNKGSAFLSVSGTLANGDAVLPTTPGTSLIGPTATASVGTTGSDHTGVANFSNATLETPGLYTLLITGVDDAVDHGLDLIPLPQPEQHLVISQSFWVLPAQPTHLAIITPSAPTPAGQSLSPVAVDVEDQYGNLVNNYTGAVTVSGTTAIPLDSGFETPSVGSGQFAYNPSNSSWLFSNTNNLQPNPSGAGISGNGSAFTSGNPNAPEGSQVAFIQGMGSISQSVNFQAGNYALMFDAAQRGNNGTSTQSIEVLVDGSAVGTITPTGTAYTSYYTDSFALSAGLHQIEFQGVDPQGGDNTAFIDQVSVVTQVSSADVVNGVATFSNLSEVTPGSYTLTASANGLPPVTSNPIAVTTSTPSQLAFTQVPTTIAAGQQFGSSLQVSVEDAFGNVIAGGNPVAVTLAQPDAAPIEDPGFETPSEGIGQFVYNPSDSSWTFTAQSSAGGSGISGNGSGFTSGNSSAPEGTQVAFIQGMGSISQSVNFQAGNYALMFDAAQRGNNGTSTQSIEVLVDGSAVGTITPTGTAYSLYSTGTFSLTAGPHTIKLLGLNSKGDNTAFIDHVSVVSPVASANTVNGVAMFNDMAPDVAGTYGWVALASGLTPAISAPFSVVPAKAFGLAMPQPPVTTPAGLLNPLEVDVDDQYGNLVTSATDSVTVSLTSGSFASGSTLTVNAVNGVAIFSNLEITKPGNYTLVAKDASGFQTTANFTVITGSASQLVVGQTPATATAGQNLSPAFTVTEEDAFGNVLTTDSQTAITVSTGAPVGDPGFEAPSVGSGAIDPNPTGTPWTFIGLAGITSNGSGFTSGNPNAPEGTQVAYIQRTGSITQSLNFPAGSYALMFDAAQRGNFGTSAQSIEVLVGGNNVGTITPTGTAYSLYSTEVFKVTSGPHTIELVGLDPQGGDNTAFIDSVSVSNSAFASGSTTTVTVADGVATFANLFLDTVGTYALSASAVNLTPATANVQVIAATASQLVVTQTPGTTTAGVALSPALQVSVEDAYGNLITTSTASVTLSGNGISATTVTAQNGVVTFSGLTLDTAGNYTLTAAATGLSSGSSRSFTVTPGSASQLAFIQHPATAIAGEVLTPSVQVEVEDKYGNLVTGSMALITVSIAPGGITATALAVNGVAAFSSLTLDDARTYSLTTLTNGVTPGATSNITVGPAAPAQLVFTQIPGTATAGQPLAPSVKVSIEDAYGNLETSSAAQVTLAVSGPGGLAAGSSSCVAASGGVAPFSNVVLE